MHDIDKKKRPCGAFFLHISFFLLLLHEKSLVVGSRNAQESVSIRFDTLSLIILQSVAVRYSPVATPSSDARTTGHTSAAIASPAPTSAACPQLSRLSCCLTPRRRGGREREWEWALRLMMSLRLLMMTLRLMMSLRLLMMIGCIRLRGDGVSGARPCRRFGGG